MREPWALPRDWHWAEWKSVARVASNLVHPADHSTLPHVAPNHIESGTGKLLPYNTVAEDQVISAKHLFAPGQILYSKIRPYLAKAVVVDFAGLCSADMYPVATDLDARYLKWWMLSPDFTRFAAGEQARTVLPKINTRALGRLPVPVAPPAEQRRIVALLEDHLSRLDAAAAYLKASQRRLIAMERAALAICRDGDLRPLVDVTEIQGGIQKQPKRVPRDNAYPFLRVANVTARGLELDDIHQIELFDGELDRLELQAGDLLVVEGNGSASQIGRAALWDGSISNCVHQNHLIRVRPMDGLLPEYLEVVWNAPANRARLTEVASSSSGLYTLSVSKLKQLSVPVPNIERQRELVDEVLAVTDIGARLGTSVATAAKRKNAFRRSLLAAAFSGQLTDEMATA